MTGSTILPAIAGLVIGAIFIVIISLWAVNNNDSSVGFSTEKPAHVTVVIPKGSSLADSEHNNFEPAVIKVVIGVNNTVRWVNQDTTFSSIRANDKSDTEFWIATNLDETRDVNLLLAPGDTFEFTFTKLGEYGYHSEPYPHKKGTVIVFEPKG